MVDVDRRSSIAHAAALRRLSTRAAPSLNSLPSPRAGLHSFSPLASAILSHLRSLSVPILPGLSPADLSRLDSPLPPDLAALLSLGLPSAPGFPDWRSPDLVLASLRIPLAAASVQISRGRLPPRLSLAALRKAPILLPLFGHCYIPCRPALAGNPVFYVREDRIELAGYDLADFFRRESIGLHPPRIRRQRSACDAAVGMPPPPMEAAAETRRSLDSIAGKAPRWIEFWSEAAAAGGRISPAEFVEIRSPRRAAPGWVGGYLERMGEVLKAGGWGESDVSEMVDVVVVGGSDGDAGEEGLVLDELILRADRCGDELRRAGWSEGEVGEVIEGFDLGRRRRRGDGWRRRTVELPPEMKFKVEKLAEEVSRC